MDCTIGPTGPRRRTLTRRKLLEIGYSTALGAAAAELSGRALARETSSGGGSSAAPRAKSVLFLFMFGGPSHLDTFDMKPQAPAEVRSEFAAIDTTLSGVQICEHLPLFAQRMHQWSLVRSMTCNPSFGDHRLAVHGLLGGQVIGRSDALGAYPATRPYRHSDVAATVYTALGIDPETEIHDLQGRPLRLNGGQAIDALYTGASS